MKLKTIRIQNFRSIEDTGEFSLEHETCLVGKNEAGKTAVLQAIAGINPHPATPFEYQVERDYPKRYLARYKDRHPDEKAVVSISKWEVSDESIKELKAEFGDAAITGNTIEIHSGYNRLSTWYLGLIDIKAAIAHVISGANLSAAERSQIGSPETLAPLLAKLKELAPASPKHKALLDIVSAYPNSSILSRVREVCEPHLPQFMYFSNYDRMEAAVHLPTLSKQAKNKSLFTDDKLRGERLFWEFLEFSGVSLDEITGANTFESFNARLQAASNTLTDEILEYWTQNQDIEVRVVVSEGRSQDPEPFNEGAIGRARIYNALHKADTSFSERSAGFTWFFSFLIKFNRVKKEAAGPVTLLLDEPGLTLHGLAQADLLRFFAEKLAPHHAIIYSTHSPFMVPHENLMASRIVEDLVNVDDRGRRTPQGTQVREDVMKASRESVFPLQGALGYSLTQTLFIGKHVVLVEGPGDILYLKALSAELGRRGRTTLDTDWVLCPAGGIDKIQSFVSLFGGNKLDIVSLSDFTKADRQKLDHLRKGGTIKNGGVLTMVDFVSQEEADVEDLFSPDLFSTIVNGAYELSGDQAVDPEKLVAANPGTQRQVKRAESYFNTLPETIPTFDHFTPSAWLLSNPDVLSGETTAVLETLNRAEEIFKRLNALKS